MSSTIPEDCPLNPENTGATIELQGAGLKAKVRNVRSQDILVVLLIIACSAFVWWSGYQQDKVTQQMLASVLNNQAAIVEKVSASIVESKEQSATLTYILTLSQVDREALRLAMPDSLRTRLNGR